MISLIVPLFLVLMILLIFYIFDLQLWIKTTSNSIDNNEVSTDSSSPSWTDNLPGAGYFSELGDNSDVSGVTNNDTTDVSNVTWDGDAMLDASGTTEEIPSYDPDDVIAMLNSIAVDTNVDITISETDPSGTETDPSGTETDPSATDLSTRVSDLEYVINTFLQRHSHDLFKLNDIYSEVTNDKKLCNIDLSNLCGDYNSCAFKCSNIGSNCAGWVYDLSNAYISTCDVGNILGDMDVSGFQSVQKQGDRAYTGGSTGFGGVPQSGV